MLTFWGAITAITVVGGLPIVGGLWMFERVRARHRNGNGACAVCGRVWSSIASGDPYLIHGHLVCEPCGERARRRMPWHLATIGLITAVATGIAAAGADMAVMVLLPAASATVMTFGAVQWMKLANRNAQRCIVKASSRR